MPVTRETIRHPLVLRRATVASVRRVVPSMVRVTLAGPELDGLAAEGPADHVKVFFPDLATGELTTPTITDEGVRRPASGVIISRDYTPLAVRVGPEGTELDLDVVVHGDEGPASAWASRVQPGSPLGIAGPRGSRLVPEGIDRLVIIADETALPASTRWLELTTPGMPITMLLDVADESLNSYFEPVHANRASIEWLYRIDGPGQLEESLRSLGPIDSGTFVFLAGEAATLVPLRRYLRHELGLPMDQLSVSGYWKRGITNLDHHAPIDPSDPD